MWINFVLHGYSRKVKEWFYDSLTYFDEINLPLKAVDYDYNRSKGGRKSIKKFVTEMDSMDEDKLFFLNMFQGKNIKYPETWEYKVIYSLDSEELMISFKKDLFDVDKTVNETIPFLLEKYLANTVARFGYFYTGSVSYSSGDDPCALNLYKEDLQAWDEIDRWYNLQLLKELNILMLRHVYPINLLNKRFLDYKNDNFNFREWLDSGEFGTLEKIGQANWLWRVPEDKIHEAGKILYEQDLLLGVDSYQRILAGYGVDTGRLTFKLNRPN